MTLGRASGSSCRQAVVMFRVSNVVMFRVMFNDQHVCHVSIDPF